MMAICPRSMNVAVRTRHGRVAGESKHLQSCGGAENEPDRKNGTPARAVGNHGDYPQADPDIGDCVAEYLQELARRAATARRTHAAPATTRHIHPVRLVGDQIQESQDAEGRRNQGQHEQSGIGNLLGKSSLGRIQQGWLRPQRLGLVHLAYIGIFTRCLEVAIRSFKLKLAARAASHRLN